MFRYNRGIEIPIRWLNLVEEMNTREEMQMTLSGLLRHIAVLVLLFIVAVSAVNAELVTDEGISDADIVFVAGPGNSTGRIIAEASCVNARRSLFSCDVYSGSQATVERVQTTIQRHVPGVLGGMVLPPLKAIGILSDPATGSDGREELELWDGALTADWFSRLDQSTLNDMVLFFLSANSNNLIPETGPGGVPADITFHEAILGAGTTYDRGTRRDGKDIGGEPILGAGARTYIGMQGAVLLDESFEVFECFWNKVFTGVGSLDTTIEMKRALAECNDQAGVSQVRHMLSGTAGVFPGLARNVNNFFNPNTVEVEVLSRSNPFIFRATFTNSFLPIVGPFFKVVEISGENLLSSADGNLLDGVAAGRGGTQTMDVGEDGILKPGESASTTFEIQLQSSDKFEFFVDVLGHEGVLGAE